MVLPSVARATANAADAVSSQYFRSCYLPADGMNAAGRHGDFGMSPWQLCEEGYLNKLPIASGMNGILCGASKLDQRCQLGVDVVDKVADEGRADLHRRL
jgi:hypothetical protein